MSGDRRKKVDSLRLCYLMALLSMLGTIASGLANWDTAFAVLFVSMVVWIAMFFVVLATLVRYDKAHRPAVPSTERGEP